MRNDRSWLASAWRPADPPITRPERAIGRPADPADRQGNVDVVDKRFEPWDKSIVLVMAANRELSVAEQTLRRQVSLARRAGHSWAAIGTALGVTRQAAQQRFGAPGEVEE
jgi:hypothetical protein